MKYSTFSSCFWSIIMWIWELNTFMKLFSDNLLHVGGIFCDLTKTFDCVNHKILLAKLHFYGIWGIYEDWFRSHIANRRQKVEVKPSNTAQNFFTGWGIMKHRVPQGSILGPLLFTIYINDLLLRINSVSELILFADDTSVIITSRYFEDFCSPSYD